jgi:hypothetical protein
MHVDQQYIRTLPERPGNGAGQVPRDLLRSVGNHPRGQLALVGLPAADVLSPLAYAAAAGIAIVLIGAIVLHFRKREVLTTTGTWLLLIALAIAVVATP